MFVIEEERLTGCNGAPVGHVELPPTVVTVGAHAFEAQEGITRAVLPGNVRTISDNAFCGCAGLEEVLFSEGVRRLGNGCFMNCRSLAEVVLPDSVVSIRSRAFMGCASLTEARLSEALRRNIEAQTFAGCVSLERIRIPAGVQQIKPGAFAGCIALRTVEFGSGEVQILPGAFIGCMALDEPTRAFIAGHIVSNEAVNINSRAAGPAGRLSNFTARRFVFDGVECGSVEGVLQSFKCPDPQVQAQICMLAGSAAMHAGRQYDWKTEQTLYWQGRAYPRLSAEYRQLVERLYEAVFAQDEGFRMDLADVVGRKLDHRMGSDDPTRTVLSRREFLQQLVRLRERFE